MNIKINDKIWHAFLKFSNFKTNKDAIQQIENSIYSDINRWLGENRTEETGKLSKQLFNRNIKVLADLEKILN